MFHFCFFWGCQDCSAAWLLYSWEPLAMLCSNLWGLKEHFSLTQPSYHLISLNRQLFPPWHSAPCSDWCRKASSTRNCFAGIWREELTDLRQRLLSVSFHRLFEISACYLLYAVANLVPPSFVRYSGTQIVLYEPGSFFILGISQ